MAKHISRNNNDKRASELRFYAGEIAKQIEWTGDPAKVEKLTAQMNDFIKRAEVLAGPVKRASGVKTQR